jgi:hypothetical protein
MSEVWDIVLWTAIPAVLLLPTFTLGAYWLFRHFNGRGRPPELPVERAYRQATAREMKVPEAGQDDPASRLASAAPSSTAMTAGQRGPGWSG